VLIVVKECNMKHVEHKKTVKIIKKKIKFNNNNNNKPTNYKV